MAEGRVKLKREFFKVFVFIINRLFSLYRINDQRNAIKSYRELISITSISK